MPRGRRTRELMSLTWEVKNPASSMATVTLLILAFLCKGLQSQYPGYDLKALKAVTVQRGLCVHIPCNFTYHTQSSTTSEDPYPGKLYAYWIKNDGAESTIRNTWHKNSGSVVASSDKDQRIASFAGNRFQLTGNPAEGDCSFSINDAQFWDAGQYYFRIEKGELKFSYRFYYILPDVSVTDPPQDIRITRSGHPDFSTQKEKLVVQEGDTVSLLCEAQGKPIPSVTWMKKNKTLNNHMQGSKETLQLSNITSEDAGMYQCQAENPHGSIRKDLSVIVQYAPKLSKKPQKNTTCWRKDNDILCNCSLHSKPPPQIHWQVGGMTVAENSSTADLKVSSSVQENEVTSSLIWTGSPDGDLSIICLGSNSLGVYTMQFHLCSLKTASSELIVPLVLGLILMKVLFCFVFFSLAFWYSNRRKAPLTQEGRRKQKE